MQTTYKKILEVLKSGSDDENLGDLLKDFFSPAFTSTPLKEATLEFYGHFIRGFFRTAASSIVSSGAKPTLISSIDLIYPYYRHFQNHVKVNEPLFLPKVFHLVLVNITETVDYADYVLKFATYLYNELQLVNSEDNIDVLTQPGALWNFAGKLEKQPNFTDYVLSLRVRHMYLKLLALKAKNLPSLVTKLGSAILKFRQQMSASCSTKSHSANFESASVWNNIIETVLLAITKEDKPKEFLLNFLLLHVHHARFISFYNNTHSDSLKNFGNVRSFLDQHIDEDDEYTESVFKICDAILFIGDSSKKTAKALESMFGSVKDANTKLAAAVTKDRLTFGQVSLICAACGIFIEDLSQYEPLKTGKLKVGVLKMSVTLLEAYIKIQHSYYLLQQKNPAENKDKASRQDVYMCTSYFIFMEILYTLSETDDSNKWLLKTLSVAKSYINDLQNLSETSAKIKETHSTNLGLTLKKFGRLCYNEGHNEAGIAIYRLLLEQMKSQDLSEELNEKKYLKSHEFLAEFQKRINDWDGSFETILSCILIASGSAFSTAIKIWLRVKKEAVKDLPDIANKTLQTLIKDNTSVIGKTSIDVAALLQLEWESIPTNCNFLRKKHKDYAVAVLTDLADLLLDPFVKSRYLYELALILWITPQPTSKSGKDYLIEAIHLMEPLLKSAQPKDKFLLGQAYLLLYAFEQEESNPWVLQRAKFFGTHTAEAPPVKVKPSTLEIEFSFMEKLDLSLELFEEAAAAIGDEMCSSMTTTDIEALAYSLIFAASVYTASLKPLDTVRALTVAVEVCQLTENSELKLKVLCEICSILSSLGYPALAKSLMDTKYDNVNEDSTASYSEKMSLLVKTLTQAELFAEQGEFSKALQLTQEVLSNCDLTSNRNKSSCAILGWARRLLSKLKLIPQHMDDDASVNEDESPLDLAYEAMRMYTAVIHCVFKPDASEIGGETFDFEKYEIVSELLKSILHLSQLYCHIGEERDAKCYIKEGLRLAEIFVLPRWSATFYLQLVRINFLSGKSVDIIVAKQEAQLILLLSNTDKKEVAPESPCPEVVEPVFTPENQTAKAFIANKFKWSAECSDEESTLKADTFADHTPLIKHTVSKVVYSPASLINPSESPVHCESCLCPKCHDVVTLELQLKCKMISGEYDYTFGRRPFQDNLQSDIEAVHLQLSGIIKANLERTFLNKVLDPLVKKRDLSSSFKMTTDQSIHCRNTCIDLARTHLIRAQVFEQEGKFQFAFDSAKKGLVLLGNVNAYNNSDVFFLRAGFALSLANTIPCVSDRINIDELLKPTFNLDLLSSQLSDMSLNREAQRSPVNSINNSEGNSIESCVSKIAALSIEGGLPLKRRGDKTLGTKKKLIADAQSKNLESVKKTNSIQNSILLSPFPKKVQSHLAEEKAAVEAPPAIQFDINKELPEEGTTLLDIEVGPKIRAKAWSKTTRTSRTSRASNKPKETQSRADSEIETGREGTIEAVDDCKMGNFDKIIEREIEEEPERKEEKVPSPEKLDTIEDVAPISVEKQSPCEKKKRTAKKPTRATNRKGRNCTSEFPETASKSPLASDSYAFEENESKENIYAFDRIDKEMTVTTKVAKTKRQPVAKNKTTGRQKRLAEASNENTPPVVDEDKIQSPCEKKNLIADAQSKTLESVTETNLIVLSPFPKKVQSQLTEEKVAMDVDKEEPEEGTATLDREDEPKIKAKAVRKTSRTSKTSRVPIKVKETRSRADKEIVTGRESSLDAGDDRKIGNFVKITDRSIEEEPERKAEKVQTPEKLDTIEDVAPLCKNFVDSIKTQSPCEKKKSTAKKTTRATNRKGKNCTSKIPETASTSSLASKREKTKSSESEIIKSRKAVDSYGFEESEEENIYDFDEIDKEKTVTTKVGKTKRQPASKNKPTGWQKRLAEASNRIGREIKRGEAESPLEKRFSVSPMSLSPAVPLNESYGSISLLDDDNSFVSSMNTSACFSFEDIKTNMRDWESFSGDLLNVSSPELLRAAKDDDSPDDCGTYRERRSARRGPARTLVSTGRKKGCEKDKTLKECQDKSSDPLRSDMRLRSLESAFDQMRLFPPCSLYNFTCKALAMNYLPHDMDRAAFYLTEAQAVTLRHCLITQLSRKIRKLMKGQKKGDLCVQDAPSLEILTQAKQALSFGQKPSNIHSLIESMDPAWTVCHVSVVASPNFSSPPILIVTQYRHNMSPTIVSLPGYSQLAGCDILKSYESIQIANRKSLSLLNKNEWWNSRITLDTKMQVVLHNMEQHWLGCWKGILLGHLTNEDDRKKLKSSAKKLSEIIKEKCSRQPNLGLLQILIDSRDYLSAEELNTAIREVTGLDDVQASEFISIKSQILQMAKSLNSSISDRNPLILILDKVVQHLPWENLPILRNRAVSRISSLYYLKVQMSYLHHKNSVITDGFDPKNTFYVLNPDDNLPCTAEMFQKTFESADGWEGVVGKPPTADQFISALTQKDTMIYCGHGNGSKYLHGDYLQQLSCRAAAVLMGCSSGHMEAKGILDEAGMINNYYLAFCPVIVANLWDVTDRDIDRFLQTLLNNWILSKDKTKMSLSEALVKARRSCKLTYLIGCAPVVYGIPL